MWYVVMNRIWRPVLKTGYFWKRKDYRRVTLHRLVFDLEVLSPLVTGSPDVIENYPDLQGLREKCLRFCSIPEQTCMDCVSDVTIWDIKLISFQIHFCWWRRIYSLSLTPFSETYELRGYVVEIYQRYIPIW